MQAAICVFHQRFSTNTSPRWPLAQRSATSPTTARSTPSPATASGQGAQLQVRDPADPGSAGGGPFCQHHGIGLSSLDNMLIFGGGMDLFRAMRL